MAQKQYTTYQSDILSFELRDALVGLLKPGRYFGYDQMTEYQTQVGTSVYVEIDNDVGINKYDKTFPTPVLEAERGIVLTPQGTVIAEDFTTALQLTIVLSATAGAIFHTVYLEHAYHPSTPGANNATYGFKSGTEGGGPAALDNPSKQVALGYILEADDATDFSDLSWWPAPPQMGDYELEYSLFGYGAYPEIMRYRGAIDANSSIIGSRGYQSSNYVTPQNSLTVAIGDLDSAIKDREDEIDALALTKLDDWATPDDNTDLDATTTRHGLLPKLSDEPLEFLDGQGNWNLPPAGFIFRGNSSSNDYNITTRGGTIVTTTTHELDMSGIVPAGFDQVYIHVDLQCFWGAANTSGRYGQIMFSKGGTSDDKVSIMGPMAFAAASIQGSPSYIYDKFNLIVNLSSARVMRIGWGNFSGAIEDWLYDMQITVLGWR